MPHASLLVTLIFADFSTIRWLSLLTLALVAVWAVAARYAGKQFAEMENRRLAKSPQPDNAAQNTKLGLRSTLHEMSQYNLPPLVEKQREIVDTTRAPRLIEWLIQ